MIELNPQFAQQHTLTLDRTMTVKLDGQAYSVLSYSDGSVTVTHQPTNQLVCNADIGQLLVQAVEEIEQLRQVCAEMYQYAGAADAPERVLDNLSAAMCGEELPHMTILPITDADV